MLTAVAFILGFSLRCPDRWSLNAMKLETTERRRVNKVQLVTDESFNICMKKRVAVFRYLPFQEQIEPYNE